MTDFAILLVNAWQIHFGNKGHARWLIGILVSALDLEGVDAVLVDRLNEY